ncbi:hemocyte protein-glutamine gamma-glutamyltransferase-like [Panonychus citri]|uniref:hemocyte protein-glutamine gamma-glutamyltransferase-like n=1 Tax=Panonychus citri TaxID=50023 RepID=UPI002307BF0A|nr:hemocyte protein-glutamine gamma-glutamyltransferase-like [Panonychus citri]
MLLQRDTVYSPFHLYSVSHNPILSNFLLSLSISISLSLTASSSSVGPQPNEVYSVDLLSRQNAKQHATIKYELLDGNFPPLIVRRGATFKMTIGLVKSYKPSLDKIRMEFMYGPRPQLGKGTLIYLPITLNTPENKDTNKWRAKILSVSDNQLLIEVYIPPTAAVAAWKLRISTKQNGSRNIRSFDVREDIYILFNPWSKLDTVYLEREDLKHEFVLMDIGKIYIGSYNQPKGRQWIYGQFNRDVLPAIMYMMGKTRLDYAARSNPIKVVRAVAQMVNSHDDNGLLVGNWSGDYKSGTPPWSWTGSAPILEQYLETNGEPVKFGQCWVFAGVTTTVCRALGIPARTVTNFVSAHDTDDSLTVDKFFDAKGQPITDVNADSIWNFHVWTDVWMTRPDLPAGYGGWQVIDATPQETSEGLYRTGPASVEAVRRGEIGLHYDAPFVFAEVNADLVHWKLDETSPLGWKKMMTNKHHVGRKIITKKVGYISEAPDTRDADDITERYKNKEGTAEERMSVLNAARAGGLAYLFEIPEPDREDIKFELVKIERVPIGQPFHIIVRMYNKSPLKRTITLSVSVNSVFYTGILAHKVKTERREIDIGPGKVFEHRVNILVADYLPYLVDYSMLKIYAVASVKETSQTWSEEDDFAVEKPPLALTVVSSGHGLTVGVPFNLAIEITNPLNVVLTSCKLTVEGTSLVNRVQTVAIPDINKKTKISHVVQLTPRRPGESNIVVTFQSKQLGDVYGSKTILIG